MSKEQKTYKVRVAQTVAHYVFVDAKSESHP